MRTIDVVRRADRVASGLASPRVAFRDVPDDALIRTVRKNWADTIVRALRAEAKERNLI